MWGEMEPFRWKDYCPMVAAIARSELTANGRNVTAKSRGRKWKQHLDSIDIQVYFIQTKSTKE
jgi:hypothetical protein